MCDSQNPWKEISMMHTRTAQRLILVAWNFLIVQKNVRR